MISGQLRGDPSSVEFYDSNKPKRDGTLFDKIQELERRYDGRPLPLELTISEAQELSSAYIAWSGAMSAVWMIGIPVPDSFETITFKEQPIHVLSPFEFREGAD